MSALPGYINGNVSTSFPDQIEKGLNLKRSALISILDTFHDPSGENIRLTNNLLFLCLESGFRYLWGDNISGITY